jgi:HAD superfamily hydrolase (TIGR01549 family)
VDRDRWVLFDLDGTLFDYHASESAAVSATLGDGGVHVTDDLVAVYREVNARHWRALERGETTPTRLRRERWEETFTELGVSPLLDVAPDAGRGADAPDAGRDRVAVLAERYLEHLAVGTHLIEDAEAVLARLAPTHGIAFLTNGLADVQRPRLSASPIGALADVTVISDEVGATKPDPAIFDAVFAAMGDPDRADVVLVGDSLTADVAGGVAYGLTTVWFDPAGLGPAPPDGPQPTHRIARLTDLPALVGA